MQGTNEKAMALYQGKMGKIQTDVIAYTSASSSQARAGKGFAAVADGVRKLAQRSAQAVWDTASLIEGTVTRVENGSEIAAELDTSFKEINEGRRRWVRSSPTSRA